MKIVDSYLNFFFDGMNGLRLDAIFLALEHEGRMDLLEKVQIYTFSALRERTRKREPVKQFKSKRGKK